MVSPAGTVTPASEPPPSPTLSETLRWVPVTDETRLALAMWLAHGTDGEQPEIPASAAIVQRLALLPSPRALGRLTGWRDRFGYSFRDVASWVAAGPNAELAILSGTFDEAAIDRALRESGYRRMRYRGVRMFVHSPAATPTPILNGDSIGFANAIALQPNLLLIAASPELVQLAIEAGRGQRASLATDPFFQDMLHTLAPFHGLMIRDAKLHAMECGFLPSESKRLVPSGRSIALAYRDAGSPQSRRTLVANVFRSQDEANSFRSHYVRAWYADEPLVEGSSLAVFGRLVTVVQSGPVVLAELASGRDDGWIRSGIRFAVPVCAAAASAVASATTPSR
ncbi:MAG: hypothetical protein C4346_01845 [Chloroflexota bacterium]